MELTCVSVHVCARTNNEAPPVLFSIPLQLLS